MTKSNKTYWQISAGDGLRDYSEVFFDFGIIFIGPDYGDYHDNKEEYQKEVRTFVEQVKPGDIVILKRKVAAIVAAGIVEKARCVKMVNEHEDGYFYSNRIFGNVQGFTTAHGRYVTWYKPDKEKKVKGLAIGSFKRCPNTKIQQASEDIIKKNQPIKPNPIPSPANPVDDLELIRHLIENGLGTSQAEEVVNAFRRVRLLGQWYEDHYEERDDADEEICEHETRTFLIIPLLLALGWPEQRLKIEWKRMDIAFFETNYKPGQNPIMILESKKLYNPLLEAKKQAERYSEKYSSCEKTVTSNGIRYLLFKKQNNKWTPKAYLDLLKLADRHPYNDKIKGAQELLTELLP